MTYQPINSMASRQHERLGILAGGAVTPSAMYATTAPSQRATT